MNPNTVDAPTTETGVFLDHDTSTDIRVLHVDDEPEFAEMAAAFLTRENDRFQVETERTAADALERLTTESFDCIVSDYDMPGTDGIELLESTRERGFDVPFILYTGKGSERIAAEAISAGATDYLQKKPGSEQYVVLANRIENAVEQARSSRQMQQIRKLFSQVAARSDDVVWIFSRDWSELSFVNGAYEDIYGKPIETLQEDPRSFLEAVHPTDRDDVEAAMDRLSGGDPVDIEYRANEAEEYDRWVWVRGTPITDETGTITHVGGFSRDVTERKRREQALERSERYRKRLHRIVTDDTDRANRIRRLLCLGCEFLGVENGHVVDIDPETNTHEVRFARGSDVVEAGAVFDLSETFCRRTIDTEGVLDVHDVETRGLGDDPAHTETGIHCYIGAKLLVDDDLFGTLCFVDRTPRKEPLSGPQKAFVDLMSRWISHVLEREAAERRTEEIFDRMADGVFALDEEWQFTYFNERGAEVIAAATDEEYSRMALLGRNIWEEIPEATDTTFHQKCHEAMTEQRSVSFEAYYEPLDSWFDVRAYPSDTGLSVYFQDITERRNREETVRNREETLREVYDVISDADLSFDEQVDSLLTIGRRVIGTDYGSLSRLRGERYVFEVVQAPEETIEAGDVVDLAATNCERTVLTEETLVLADVATDAPELTEKDGYTEWGISCYVGAPVVVEEQTYGTFCFYDTRPRREPFSEWQVTLVDLMARWISYELERKRVEKRLRRQNDHLEEFTSMLSHDLRNPLSVATGRLELLAEECGETADLQAIRDAHDRIETLVSDILTMSREGMTIEETEPVDLSALATESWEYVDTDDATLDVSDSIRLLADPDRLGQILENLFRNAVEHGATEGRSLTVRVGKVPGGFYVEDDGVGIPEGERDEVFEYGYTEREDGTGLGLSIVERAVEAHGWHVEITESAEGGARFEITGVDLR